MRTLLALMVVLVAALAVAAEMPKTTLKNPAAAAAQQRFAETLQRARAAYAAELDPAIKAVLAAGSLEQANELNQLKTSLLAGGMPPIPGAPSKMPAANEPRVRFERTVTAAQRQYLNELPPALRAAMAAGQLEEANAINAEIRSLSAVAPPGLVLTNAPIPPPRSTMEVRSGPGLTVTRYPLHQLQKDGSGTGGRVPYEELGQPLSAPKTVKTLKWIKDKEVNATAAGFLRIERPGSYDFASESEWDRNELVIDGTVVCRFRDGEKAVGTIELTAGLHSIVSVGYAIATTETHVRWKPPGAAALTEIPANLLSH